MKTITVIRAKYKDLGLMKQAIRMSKDSCCGGRANVAWTLDTHDENN